MGPVRLGVLRRLPALVRLGVLVGIGQLGRAAVLRAVDGGAARLLRGVGGRSRVLAHRALSCFLGLAGRDRLLEHRQFEGIHERADHLVVPTGAALLRL